MRRELLMPDTNSWYEVIPPSELRQSIERLQ